MERNFNKKNSQDNKTKFLLSSRSNRLMTASIKRNARPIYNALDKADIVIIGAGCAGLSLARRLSNVAQSKITLIDPCQQRLPHILAYWDNGEPALDLARPLSCGEWVHWQFQDGKKRVRHTAKNHIYRAIQSDVFESALKKDLQSKGHVNFRKTSVMHIEKHGHDACVHLRDGTRIKTLLVFDTRPPQPDQVPIKKHFLGWRIRAEGPLFNPTTVTLMDFQRGDQDAVRFFYILPFSEHEALVEATVCSKATQCLTWYERQMSHYLSKTRGIGAFKILKREQGIIPLSWHDIDEDNGIYPVGLRAGAMRLSSGRAFSQIQRQAYAISEAYAAGEPIIIEPGCDRVEQWMDHIVLRTLRQKPHYAPDLFLHIAHMLNGDHFAAFMQGHAGWPIRSRLIACLPSIPFINAVFA